MSVKGIYRLENYTQEILSTAKQVGENSYFIPKLNMNIKLKKGKKLIHWVERYVNDAFQTSIVGEKNARKRWDNV